ncbi:MAG TPA: hypothetical protein VKB80_16415 [Kofleriaceae bacterium]|nr:hypothetical protein [Kofleriaceae bacterium]
MPDSARQKWFAHMLSVGMEEKLLSPAQLVGFLTPEVLAHHLPPDVMSRLLASSLAAGQMTPDRLFETLTPDVLVDSIPLEVLWRGIDAGAERAGIAGEVVRP